MNKWDGLNRRRFPRVVYPCLVTLKKINQEEYAILTHTENIGIGGVCVTLKEGLKMFSAVHIELDLVDLQDHIRCEGKVVWSVRRKSDAVKKPLFWDTGIQFEGLSDHNRQRIEDVIIRLTKNQKQPLDPTQTYTP